MPQHVVLVNQKLEGFWQVTVDHRATDFKGLIKVAKFEKCKKEAREAHACIMTSMYVDSTLIIKRKLSKEVKLNWAPTESTTYWVERKRDKETKMPIIHLEERNEIMLKVLKKELEVYNDTTLVIQAKKLK